MFVFCKSPPPSDLGAGGSRKLDPLPIFLPFSVSFALISSLSLVEPGTLREGRFRKNRQGVRTLHPAPLAVVVVYLRCLRGVWFLPEALAVPSFTVTAR